MKISKKEIVPKAPVVKPVVPSSKVDVDNERLVKSINALTSTLKEKDMKIVNDISPVLSDINKNERANYKEFVKYLNSKIDILIDTVKSKPTSFNFDIKRNQYGYIQNVIVKPIKEK